MCAHTYIVLILVSINIKTKIQICHIVALKIPQIKVYFTHNVCQLSSPVGLLYIMLYKTSTHMFISLNFNVLCCAFKCFSHFVESNCRIKI